MDLLHPELEGPRREDGRSTRAVVALLLLVFGVLGPVGRPAAAQEPARASERCASGTSSQAVDLPSGTTSTFCYRSGASAVGLRALPSMATRGVTTGTVSTPPSISLVKTVGVGPTCAATSQITVTTGTQVTYCYTLNFLTGDATTLSSSVLVDDRLGTISAGAPLVGSSVSVTTSATLATTTTNVATWTAGYPSSITSPAFLSSTAVATATVHVIEPPPQPPPPPPPLECAGHVVTVDLALGQSPTPGPDVIRGTPGPDQIGALGGDDIVCALGGDDVVNGGPGLDRVFGGGGQDAVRSGSGGGAIGGGPGTDTLTGGVGADVLRGRGGGDTLLGRAGNDVLDGGGDPDSCDGGTGVDTAVDCETVTRVP